MNGHENTSLQRVITVRTPENLELNYALAGAGTRAAAYVIDFLIMAVIVNIASNFLALLLIAVPSGSGPVAMAVVSLIGAAAYNSYFMFFEWLMSGQTPGKRVVGIRVIKEGGYALGVVDTLLRNLMRFVDFLPAFYGVGLVSLLVSPRSQRLGDIVTGTLVVYQDQLETESLVPEIPEPGGVMLALPVDLLAAIPREIIEACGDFFRIMPHLANRNRQELAVQLADLVAQTSGIAPDRLQSAESFLASIIRQSEQTAELSAIPVAEA